jgi:hypothetical protein
VKVKLLDTTPYDESGLADCLLLSVLVSVQGLHCDAAREPCGSRPSSSARA